MTKPDSIWFHETVRSWHATLSWTPEDLDRAATLLAEISTSNGGTIIVDSEISDADKAAYAVLRAQDAVQRRMNRYAGAVSSSWRSQMHVPTDDEPEANLPGFLKSMKLEPKLELNGASLRELAALPGIGKVTGQRILDRRERLGPYRSLSEVRENKGISKADFEKFYKMIYIQDPGIEPAFRFGPLDAFRRSPDLSSYIHLLEVGGSLTDGDDANQPLSSRVLQLLEEVRHETSISKFGTFNIAPYTLASRAAEELSVRRTDLSANSVQGPCRGGLLHDRQYLPFMKRLLAECTHSLDMAMFFFRFQDEEKYVTDALVDQIVKAHESGIAVRIIVDIDEEDDPFASRDINANIYEYLTRHGVPVRRDRPEQVTHSKLVVVDQRYVVLGSHNWTAGSFYVYDDVSVFLDSPPLGVNYTQEFDRRWLTYEA